MASEIFDEIIDRLNDGLCYHADVDGLLCEINWEKLEKEKPAGVDLEAITPRSEIIQATDDQIRNALQEILESGKIEIGETELDTPDYLTFVAWVGSVEERVVLALKSVHESPEGDRLFAYWLCLKENIDRYEKSREIESDGE